MAKPHPRNKLAFRTPSAAPAHDSHFLYGYHPVREAMHAARRDMYTLFLLADKAGRFRELENEAGERAIACRHITAEQMTAMLGHDRHQGILAKVSAYPFSDLNAILSIPASPERGRLILLLDQVVDPQNFGAIARTAFCSGVQAMILPRRRSAPPSAAAVKASAGALEHLHLAYVSNLVAAIEVLKKNGFWVAGADRRGHSDVFTMDLTGSLALVIGGEENGIRPLVKQQCDFLITIPQLGALNSLNASVAAAVILYEAFRQFRIKASQEIMP